MSMTGENYEEEDYGWGGQPQDSKFEQRMRRRREEGSSRVGAFFGSLGETLGSGLSLPVQGYRELGDYLFGTVEPAAPATGYQYDWTDPYTAALNIVAEDQSNLADRYRTYGTEAYNRYLQGLEPGRAAAVQQVQAAWDPALAEMGGQAATMRAIAQMAEEENLRSGAAAQAAGTALAAGRGGAAPTMQTGMGGATNVGAYDLANAAAIAGATQGAGQRGRLGAQAAGVDYLQRTLAAAPASWQGQMQLAAQMQDAAAKARIEQDVADRIFAAQEAQRAQERAIQFEREQAQVLVPAYRAEYNKLGKKEKKELRETLGIDNADEYVFYQMRLTQSQAGALGTMAAGE